MTYGINSPKGLQPHSYVNGQPYTGALSTFQLNSGTRGNIFTGDPVVINPGTGGIRRLAVNTGTGADNAAELVAGSAVPILGVFMGCKYQAYQNGVLEVIRSSYWLDNTQTYNNVPAEAMIVVADNQILFDIQISTSMTTLAGTTLATTYAGAAAGIVGQFLTLGIGTTNGSVGALAGNAIPTNSVYYGDGTPVLANPTTGNPATFASAFYADIGANAAGANGLGNASGAGYHLQVVGLTPRVDQVSYPNLGSGYAISVGQNNLVIPPQVSTGSFNNVLVQINNATI